MNAVEFEDICRKSGYVPIPKRFTPKGNVLLAEKTRFDSKIHSSPWVETLWAVERDDCHWANLVRNDFAAVVNGVARSITKEDRIKDAMEQAEMVLSCMESGRKKAKEAKR